LFSNLTYKRFGEKAILIEWEHRIDETILNDILVYKEKITLNKKVAFVDIIQGYNSLTISYKNQIVNFDKEVTFLKSMYTSTLKETKQVYFQWEIPVCYDLEFGVDLEEISIQKNISVDEIIKRHKEAVYKIYFIGFLPGFLYLGGLNESLFVDRKSNPRLNVAKGVVGIGGKQTGVYPNNSAGGWNIIGKTPINFFNIEQQNPCFAKPGDSIKFKLISLDEFYQLENQIRENTYQLLKTAKNA
jgi:inhibitor of KinA